MERPLPGRAGREPIEYRIVVTGTLGETQTGALEDLTVRQEGDHSVLTGPVVDQAQLHGILDQLGVIGVEIVSVTPAD